MAIKKSQLYSTLWESCNALRGSMDAGQYKDYVLMILFVKYLSDKAKKGQRLLQVPDGCYFDDFVALKQTKSIGEDINKKLEKIKEANATFISSLTLPNFNDPQKLGEGASMVDTLSKLIGVFENEALDFSKNRTADDDLLGDAYEYLMKNFAAESGKSKGQFYTPAEVSRVIAQVLGLEDFNANRTTIYDPTCGSGSLLLRAMSETATGRASLYGQEKDSTTASLAQLNMLLHGINNARISVGDTLNNPQFTDMGTIRAFDVCIANPPFSVKNWLQTGMENDPYNRWNSELLPPAKCGDYAFLLHLIRSMKAETGRGACILPHGVLFRGNAEAELRKKIIKTHHLKGIIGLPANIFFGTGIPASILIFDKAETTERKGIFFIDAKDGFMKDGAKNRLREQDIKRIVDAWNNQKPIDHFCRLVSWEEIEKNDYNLNIPRYITPVDTEIQQSIDAHLHGGLPAEDITKMQHYWTACPTLHDALFRALSEDRFALIPEVEDIDQVVKNDSSFQKQHQFFEQSLQAWADWVKPYMKVIGQNLIPKHCIEEWSEELLKRFKTGPSLVSAYDVYDHLMNYWMETLQDDCYMIANDGWVLSPVTMSKKKGIYSDLVCDLLPVDILLREYFDNETEAIAVMQGGIEDLASQLETMEEEDEEAKDTAEYKSLAKQLKSAKAALKVAQTKLTEDVQAKYQSLSTDDLKTLVVERKWLQSIVTRCVDEMNRLTNDITSEVTTLYHRYEDTLSDLTQKVNSYETEVNSYLQEMGFTL